MTIKLLIFLACIIPTIYEIADDAKGEDKADKRLDFWRASALVLLFALLALYFIGMNPLKIILASFGWRMLVFDYAINIMLSLNEVVPFAKKWFEYLGGTAETDQVKIWRKMGSWGRFTVRFVVFTGSLIYFLW